MYYIAHTHTHSFTHAYLMNSFLLLWVMKVMKYDLSVCVVLDVEKIW